MKTVFLFCTALGALCLIGASIPLHAAPVGMAKRLIDQLHMEQIPDEGPWFTVTYVGKDTLPGSMLPDRYHGRDHAAGSAIYDVLTREDFSALHRLQTDETWHFYGGDPIEMLLLYPDGHGEQVTLGPDVFAGQQPQFTVPRGVWQGSAPNGAGPESYGFVGNQLSPAFDYRDFEIGYRDELQRTYPKFAAQIERLTRTPFATRPAGAGAAPPPGAGGEAAATPTVRTESALPAPVEIAPGMWVQELTGRTGVAKSERQSVARFTVKKGHATLVSHNKVSEETFLVVRGHGQVILGTTAENVGPGSFVMMPPAVRHQVVANGDEDVEFYAIESPAYRPEDFVVEPEPKER